MKPLLLLSAMMGYVFSAAAQTSNSKLPLVKALVVGISEHQDSALLPFRAARRDAEEFAAFLQSVPGGSVERDQIFLLTDREATLARFVAALDWLLDEKPAPAKRLLYIAGAAKIVAPGQKQEDVLLFFHDSPPAPLQGNTFSVYDLQVLLERSLPGKPSPFALVVSFKSPFIDGNGLAFTWKDEGKNRKSAYLKWSTDEMKDSANIVSNSSQREKTISNDMVAGLLGLADRDDNMKVNGREIFRYLKNQPPGIAEPGEFFYMAVSDKESNLSKVDEHILADLQRLGSQYLFPAIVHLESIPAENKVLRNTDPATQQLYEDFILAIKVKNFLPPPPEHNATALYDSLASIPALQPIAGYLRRRLAAAMLDDTQQALNAYLNTSAKELNRRRKNSDQYKLYAQLLGKADELLGERHYMHKTLQAKQLYFEGLAFRLQFLSVKDSTLLLQALEKQLAALQAEPEAAYIFNELGVVYLSLNKPIDAQKQLLAATEFSPAWGVPYINLCMLSLSSGDWAAANDYGIKAVSLAPWNADAYATLGFVYQEKKDLVAAETLYSRAVRMGTNLPDVYYNLACFAALKGEKEAALDWLRQAHEKGFDDAKMLKTDPDLDSIRADARFEALLRQFYLERLPIKD